MSFATIFNTLRAKFATDVATPNLLSTVYDNQGGYSPPENSKWAAVSVVIGDRKQVEIGSKTFRTFGVLMVRFFAPLGDGEKELLDLADATDVAFRSQHIGPIVYFEPSIRSSGRQDHWWNVTMECPFYHEETF